MAAFLVHYDTKRFSIVKIPFFLLLSHSILLFYDPSLSFSYTRHNLISMRFATNVYTFVPRELYTENNNTGVVACNKKITNNEFVGCYFSFYYFYK